MVVGPALGNQKTPSPDFALAEPKLLGAARTVSTVQSLGEGGFKGTHQTQGSSRLVHLFPNQRHARTCGPRRTEMRYMVRAITITPRACRGEIIAARGCVGGWAGWEKQNNCPRSHKKRTSRIRTPAVRAGGMEEPVGTMPNPVRQGRS